MTVILVAATEQAVMVAADRKLTGHPKVDHFDATKVCRVETSDAYGTIAYSGIGANVYPSEVREVSFWIEDLLIGPSRTLEEAMQHIAASATAQKVASDKDSHTFVFAGFKDQRPWVEIITNQKSVTFFDRQANSATVTLPEVAGFQRVIMPEGMHYYASGSGAAHFSVRMIKGTWAALKASPSDIGRRLHAAELLRGAIRKISEKDRYVSSQSICVWSDSMKSGQQWEFDSAGKRLEAEIPVVANGMPIRKLVEVTMPIMMRHMKEISEAAKTGAPAPSIDKAEMDALLATLQDRPKLTF